MSPKLRALVTLLGTVTLGGGVLWFATPGRDVTRLQLVDAGILEGQAFVLVCPQRLAPKLRNKLLDAGQVGPRQRYARVARVAVCLRTDGGAGNCFGAAGNILAAAQGATVIVPSLRKLNGGSAVADDDADDSVLLERDCTGQRCADFAAGTCADPLRIFTVPLPCRIPDCRTGGVWNDAHAPVDCRATGPLGLRDGGARWRGCNVLPAALATGAECLAVECGVLQGDDVREEL